MNWSSFAVLGAASIVAAVTSGCATITASRTEQLSINSYPEGAEVRVDGMPQGHTPTTIEVEKKRPPKIQVSMPGYRSEECRVRTGPATAYVAADAALCVLFFPLGCISFIDAGGAWNQFESTSCNVGLRPVNPPQTAAAHEPIAPAPKSVMRSAGSRTAASSVAEAQQCRTGTRDRVSAAPCSR